MRKVEKKGKMRHGKGRMSDNGNEKIQGSCLTNGAESCNLMRNNNSKYDDREKVFPIRFRELPVAARQRNAGKRHWPLSSSAEMYIV